LQRTFGIIFILLSNRKVYVPHVYSLSINLRRFFENYPARKYLLHADFCWQHEQVGDAYNKHTDNLGHWLHGKNRRRREPRILTNISSHTLFLIHTIRCQPGQFVEPLTWSRCKTEMKRRPQRRIFVRLYYVIVARL